MQTNAAMMIEIVNYVSIITHFEIIDIVMKFMTLTMLMNFSDFFYEAFDEKEYKKIITDKKIYGNFLMIQRTTSKAASEERIILQSCEKSSDIEEEEDKDKDKKEDLSKSQKCDYKEEEFVDETTITEIKDSMKIETPKYMRVKFSDRKRGNRCLYLIYRFYRIMFVSFWFYFLPFFVIIVSYLVQSRFIRDKDDDEE